MALCPRPAVWTPEGLRTSEIFALLWSDFDWLRNEAFIQRGIVEGYEDETKTESSKRFSARLKCTRPTRFHAPLQRFKNSWTPHFDWDNSSPKAICSSCLRDWRTLAVRYSAPVIGGAARDSQASSASSGGDGLCVVVELVSPSAGCRGLSGSAPRILANRSGRGGVRLRLRLLRAGEDHGPIPAQKHSANVAQARAREPMRRDLRSRLGGRAVFGREP